MKLSLDDAKRAIYIDFEGTVNDPPSLLGTLMMSNDSSEDVTQYVIEEALYPAGEVKEQCTNSSLDKTLELLRELAERENRRCVAWSSREVQAINDHCSSNELKGYFEANIVDAKKIARVWKRRFFPGVVFPYVTGQGRHRLYEYLRLIGYSVPKSHGPGNTGQRIRYVRNQLANHCNDYGSVTNVTKAKWTKLLGHNFHDCRGLRDLFIKCVSDCPPDVISSAFNK